MTIPNQITIRDKKVYLATSGSSKVKPCYFGEDLSTVIVEEDDHRIIFLSRKDAERKQKKVQVTPFNENYHGNTTTKASIYDYNADGVAGDFNYMDPTEPQNVERMYSPYAAIQIQDDQIFIFSRRRIRTRDW